ncbi:YslB family protein [Neobacillus niacini]|jgi:predicted hydrocarbon binding protein|uniref:YslB family protein n=1 Tax=Neobacillus niacini TaxID=86668 RepID=UPI001C8F13D5|nr:YslB family protein [Neobacillus niacini]MBY0146650.1 YslB family protein [Neobacillus niacini]
MNESTAVELNVQSDESRNISLFGYELIREFILPEILGKDTPEILYWAGKSLARKHPLNTFDDIVDFFVKASWGHLEIKKERKDEIEFELASPLIISRVKSKAEHYFQIEAGFLAQQIQLQKQVIAETFEHPVKKANKVQFTVKWDRKDTL